MPSVIPDIFNRESRFVFLTSELGLMNVSLVRGQVRGQVLMKYLLSLKLIALRGAATLLVMEKASGVFPNTEIRSDSNNFCFSRFTDGFLVAGFQPVGLLSFFQRER